MSKIEPAPLVAARREAWRAEWRTVVRLHHPDVGGDLQEYLRATADIDRRYGQGRQAMLGSAPEARVHVSVRSDRRSKARRQLRASVRRVRAVSRTLRSRLPRWAPGARRYTHI